MSKKFSTIKRRLSQSTSQLKALYEGSGSGAIGGGGDGSTSNTSGSLPDDTGAKRHTALGIMSAGARDQEAAIDASAKIVCKVRCKVDNDRISQYSIALSKTVLVEASISVDHLIFGVVIPKLNTALASENAILCGHTCHGDMVELEPDRALYEFPDVVFNNCELILRLGKPSQLSRGSRVLQRPQKFDSDHSQRLFETLSEEFVKQQQHQQQQARAAAADGVSPRPSPRNAGPSAPAVDAGCGTPALDLIVAQLSLIHEEDVSSSLPGDVDALTAVLEAGRARLAEVNRLVKQPASSKQAFANQSLWRVEAGNLERVIDAAGKKLASVKAGAVHGGKALNVSGGSRLGSASSPLTIGGAVSTGGSGSSANSRSVSPSSTIGFGPSASSLGALSPTSSPFTSLSGSQRVRRASGAAGADVLAAGDGASGLASSGLTSSSMLGGRRASSHGFQELGGDDDELDAVPTAAHETDDADGAAHSVAQFLNLADFLVEVNPSADPSYERVM